MDRDDIANHYAGKTNPRWKDLSDDRKEDLVYRMATFAAMIEHVDRGIGRIIANLEDQGKLQDTLILLPAIMVPATRALRSTSSRQGFTKLHKGKELKMWEGWELITQLEVGGPA